MSDALTLTPEEIGVKFDQWGLVNVDKLIPDTIYACWDADFVVNEFAKAAKAHLDKVVGPYIPEESDCDDFAEECACFAHAVHRKTLEHPRQTAVAFGEFWYVRWDGVAHAINCFISLVKGAWALLFFEPQTCQLVELTPEEIASCDMIRF